MNHQFYHPKSDRPTIRPKVTFGGKTKFHPSYRCCVRLFVRLAFRGATRRSELAVRKKRMFIHVRLFSSPLRQAHTLSRSGKHTHSSAPAPCLLPERGRTRPRRPGSPIRGTPRRRLPGRRQRRGADFIWSYLTWAHALRRASGAPDFESTLELRI